jgi:hypothetical protein
MVGISAVRSKLSGVKLAKADARKPVPQAVKPHTNRTLLGWLRAAVRRYAESRGRGHQRD